MSKLVVIIDDNEEYLSMVKDFFNKTMPITDVILFSDALYAMSFIDDFREKIGSVFTDHNMSSKGMSGRIIVEKCKENNVPVFIVTATPEKAIRLFQCPVLDKIDSLPMMKEIICNQIYFPVHETE